MSSHADVRTTVTVDPCRHQAIAELWDDGQPLAAPVADLLPADADTPAPGAVVEVVTAAVAAGNMSAAEAEAATATLVVFVEVTELLMGGDDSEPHTTADGGLLTVQTWSCGKTSADQDTWVDTVGAVAESGRVEVDGDNGEWVVTLGATTPVDRRTVDVPAGRQLVLVDDTVAELLQAGPVTLLTGGPDGLVVGQVTADDLL